MSENIFNGYGVPIEILTSFNQIREVLTRIGIANHETKVLTQTCHIFHKRGEYSIMHFKEMFLFDGKHSEVVEGDLHRRNKIVDLLVTWRHIKVLDENQDVSFDESIPLSVITRKVKNEQGWTLVPKYTLGRGS